MRTHFVVAELNFIAAEFDFVVAEFVRIQCLHQLATIRILEEFAHLAILRQ